MKLRGRDESWASYISNLIHWTIALGSRPPNVIRRCSNYCLEIVYDHLSFFFHKWYRSPSKWGVWSSCHTGGVEWSFSKTTHIYEIAMSVTFHHWIYWCWHLSTTICIYICILFCLMCFLGLAMIHIQDKIRFWNKSFTYLPFPCQKFYLWCFGV